MRNVRPAIRSGFLVGSEEVAPGGVLGEIEPRKEPFLCSFGGFDLLPSSPSSVSSLSSCSNLPLQTFKAHRPAGPFLFSIFYFPFALGASPLLYAHLVD